MAKAASKHTEKAAQPAKREPCPRTPFSSSDAALCLLLLLVVAGVATQAIELTGTVRLLMLVATSLSLLKRHHRQRTRLLLYRHPTGNDRRRGRNRRTAHPGGSTGVVGSPVQPRAVPRRWRNGRGSPTRGVSGAHLRRDGGPAPRQPPRAHRGIGNLIPPSVCATY